MVGLDARLGALGLVLGQVDDVRVELAFSDIPELRRIGWLPPTGAEQHDDHFVLTGAAPVLRERLALGQLADVLRRLASIHSRTRSDTTSGISIWGT